VPHSRYYNYPAPVLPPIDSLPYPANLIAGCSECGLRQGCTRPVPGENVNPCKVMLVGQNPGWNEDQEGRPFIGQAGRYLDSLLFQMGISREFVCITNVVKCLTPGNRVPRSEAIQACSHWLDTELEIVQPEIVVAMGVPAMRYFGITESMEHAHGKPVNVSGRTILPAYHPAAALRDTGKMRQVSDDFQVLRGLVKGKDWREYHVVDEYPNPVYRVADNPKALKQMADEIHDSGEFAVDTEQCRGRLWSVQISVIPGTGWFIPIPEGFRGKYDLTVYDALCIVHYYLHDIQYLDIDDDKFVDTMTMAYLTGAGSQGLKELASRLCGVSMKTYRETTRSGQDEIALEYLLKASGMEWPDPPDVEETKWSNKKGELVTRIKHPWHISRKVNNILNEYTKDNSTDLWDRWQKKIPDIERSCVEDVLGVMPESSLMDIPFEQAVQYATRDADVTLRVKHKLDKMIADLELELVLQTDLRVLPLVRSMMDNGIAVDIDHCQKLSDEYDVKLRVIATQLAGMVGHPFNPNSSKQVAEVIYKELGFKPTKFTDTKEISTDDAELKKTGPHPVAKEIIHYRGILKLKTTYADNMIRSAHPDDTGVPRMHTKINTTRVETGRLSSSKTDDGEGANFQNIPTRNKDGRDIKDGFVAAPGKRLGEGDLGQVEMRTQTHLAKCKGLIELFHKKGDEGDPHTVTASRLFGVPLSEAKQSKYRYPCKRAGFGIIYMIGPRGLSTQINEYIADLEMAGEPVDVDPWDEITCQKFIDEYYKLYPEIRDYQQEMLAHARRYGYVKDIFGRVRFIPEVSCPISRIQEAGARMAANMPVTSSAQEVIKSAMDTIWEQLPRTPWADTKILIQVHDSLLFELPDDDDYAKGLFGWVNKVMTNSVKLIVPLTADFKTGKAWGSLKKLELEN